MVFSAAQNSIGEESVRLAVKWRLVPWISADIDSIYMYTRTSEPCSNLVNSKSELLCGFWVIRLSPYPLLYFWTEIVIYCIIIVLRLFYILREWCRTCSPYLIPVSVFKSNKRTIWKQLNKYKWYSDPPPHPGKNKNLIPQYIHVNTKSSVCRSNVVFCSRLADNWPLCLTQEFM